MLNPNPALRPSCQDILKNDIVTRVTIREPMLEEIHLEDIPDKHLSSIDRHLHRYVRWIYTLISHKFQLLEEGVAFSIWFVNKIIKGHNAPIPQSFDASSFNLYERRLVSDRCYAPKFK